MSLQRRGAAIEIRGLRKAYGRGPERLIALDDLDLSVRPGEFVCIVGPSGCGKSTLLGVVLGLVSPTAGSVQVGGLNMNELDMKAWRSRLAWPKGSGS